MRNPISALPVLGPALFAALALAACAPTYAERTTQLAFTPRTGPATSQAFWQLPLPSDLRLEDDGTVDLEYWPGDWDSELVKMWLLAADARAHGWGLSTGGFFPVSADLDPASLPSVEQTMQPGASVFLVDIDADSPERGRRFPLEVTYTATGDRYAPDRLLAASPVPGFVRRSNTTYAFVVTDAVTDTAGEPLGASRAFFDALHGMEGADARAVENLKPLKALLDEEGLDSARVAAAAVFTTLDADALLLEMAKFADSQPLPELSVAFSVVDETDEYVVLEGGTRFPVIQVGARPYERPGEGAIARDDDGNITIVGTQDVGLVLTLPKQRLPEAGFPLTIYMHGSGGDRWEGVDLGPGVGKGGPPAPREGPARWLAQKGIATLATDFGLHGGRHDPPDTSGLMLYNLLGNIEATVDNFHVAVMEQLLLSRLASQMVVFSHGMPALEEVGSAGVWFDPEGLSAMGFSMGSTIGIPAMAVDKRVKAFVAAGAGGSLIEIALTALQPYELKPAIEEIIAIDPGGKGHQLHAAHPLLHAFQTTWDLVDPTLKAKRLVAEPFEGVPAKHVFLSAGNRDGYFAPRSTTALAIAMGTPLVGDAVEPVLSSTLALTDRKALSFPAKHNMRGKTAAVVAYDGPDVRGHYVLFDREDARQQYTCFLRGLVDETGPVIAAPGALSTACE